MEMETRAGFAEEVQSVLARGAQLKFSPPPFVSQGYAWHDRVGFTVFRDFVFLPLDAFQRKWGAKPEDVGLETITFHTHRGEPVQGVMLLEDEAAEAAKGRLTEPLLLHVDRIFRGQGSTLSTENAFQMVAHEAARVSNNKLTTARTWACPNEGGLFSSRFQFQEISPDNVERIAARTQLPSALFEPKVSECSLNLSSIAGKIAQAPWPTFNAISFNCLGMDQKFMRWCSDNEAYDLAPKAWQTVFFQEGAVLQEKNKSGIVFVLASLPPMTIVWPLEVTKIRGQSFARFSPDAHWQELVCVDVEGWCAWEYEFLSPLSLMKICKRSSLADCEQWCIELLGKPVPLLQYAAQQAFWTLPMTEVKRIVKNIFGNQLEGDLPDVLLEATVLVLGCDLETAAKYVARRLGHIHVACNAGEYEELLTDPGVSDMISREDEKEYKDLKETVVASKAEADKIAKCVRDTISGAAQNKKRRKATQTTLPTDATAYTLATMKELAPTGSRVHHDTFNKRWEIYYRYPGPPRGPMVYKSASWGQRSMKECATIVLGVAWAEAQRFGVNCPIKDLVRTAEATPQPSQPSSSGQ